MKINVGIDAARSRLGRMTLQGANGNTAGPFDVCGTADAATAMLAGNPSADPLRPGGNVPFGAYRLQEVRPAPPEAKRDYGANMLVFQPRSGQAREAESLGRLVLVLHGGAPGDGGGLRPTGIGLRVAAETLELVVAAARRGETVDLEVREAPLSIWDRILFWRRRPNATIAGAVQNVDRDWSSSGTNSSTSSSSSEPSFGGRGGSFGGAGASGSWDAPAGSSSAATTAAGIAAVGAGAVAASELGFGGERGAPGDSGSGTGDSGGYSSSASDSGSADSGSSNSESSSGSTSY